MVAASKNATPLETVLPRKFMPIILYILYKLGLSKMVLISSKELLGREKKRMRILENLGWKGPPKKYNTDNLLLVSQKNKKP